MLFEELRTKDVNGAFWNYTTVAQAKTSGRIPSVYHPIIGNNCECGSERITNQDLTKTLCCNPRCKIKLAYMLEYLFSKFDCKNLGLATCRTIINYIYSKMEVKSHLAALLYYQKELSYVLGSAQYAYFEQAIYNIKSKKIGYGELIGKLGIPVLGPDVAAKVFSGISGGEHFVEEVEKQGGLAPYFTSKGSPDPMLHFYANEFLYEFALAEAELINRVSAVGKIRFSIVVTGNIAVKGIKISRTSFVSLCNDIGEIRRDFRLFEIKNTAAMESTDFFIADYPTTNTKYLAASRRESLEGRKLIYTADEFVIYLMNIVEEFKKQSQTETNNMEVF